MSVKPLLITKLSIPPLRSSMVLRSHLYEKLNKGLHGKLTLVSAPAGYGKTTLVSSWIKQSGRSVAWLSLDDNDNELARFLTYFVVAIQQIDRNLGVDILSALESSQSPQTQVLLTMLINEIAAHGKQFTLVMDDCHLITNQNIHDGWEFFITNQPPNLHVVIIGRVDPLISLSRLRVGGQLNEIRSDDLRFTRAEASEFLNELMGLDLSVEDIDTLEARTEGWIAGIQLAALSLQGRVHKHEFISDFSGIHHHIIDYLVDEVLNRQTEELRSFLCSTSILNSLNASLCNAILERTDSQEILHQLEETNLFLIPLNQDRTSFRYHHLFGDFLKLCLKDTQPARIPELHRRAAGWYELDGFLSEALDHLLAAEYFEDAVELVEVNAKAMMERSELANLMKLVDKLPDEYVRESPWLCIYHAWALRLSGRPYDVVESRIRDIERGLEGIGIIPLELEPEDVTSIGDKDICNMIGHVLALRAFQALFNEQIPRVIELAQRAKTFQPEENFVWSGLGFALGWAYRFSGDLNEAHYAFIEAKNISLESDNTYMACASLCRAAYGQVMAGKLHLAVKSLEEAERFSTGSDGRHLPVAGYAHVYLAGVYQEWNDLTSAEYFALKGIELCKRVGYFMDQVVGYSNLARLRISQKDLDRAQEACQMAEHLSQQMKGYLYALRWAEDCQVRLWIAQKESKKLASWVQACSLTIDDELDFRRDIDHIILARALVALGYFRNDKSYLENAITLLQRLWNLANGANWWGKGIEILVLQSLAFQRIGDEDLGLKSLEKALSLAEPEGYLRTFLDEGNPMADLLRLASSSRFSSGYVEELLELFESELLHESRSVEIKSRLPLIEPMTKSELDVLRKLASELSGPEIAEELMVALSTVRYHTNNIYKKLSVHNRRAAVRRASELNLL